MNTSGGNLSDASRSDHLETPSFSVFGCPEPVNSSHFRQKIVRRPCVSNKFSHFRQNRMIPNTAGAESHGTTVP